MMVFAVPALLALGIAVIHAAAGRREIARPLLQKQTLSPTVTLIHYYCCHTAAISLVVLAGGYAYANLLIQVRVALANVELAERLAYQPPIQPKQTIISPFVPVPLFQRAA